MVANRSQSAFGSIRGRERTAPPYARRTARSRAGARRPPRRVRFTRPPGFCSIRAEALAATRRARPAEIQAVIAAAASERDRLLLRVLWATGARISEVLALRPLDVQRDHLVLANRKNPSQPIKRVFLPAGQADLARARLLIWANEQGLASRAPLFFSRKRGADGGLQAISRVQAWTIVKAASERAGVRVLALRASQPRGGRGARARPPAPVSPCPGPPNRAGDAQPAARPAPGGLVAAPDRLPDGRRRRSTSADARGAGIKKRSPLSRVGHGDWPQAMWGVSWPVQWGLGA